MTPKMQIAVANFTGSHSSVQVQPAMVSVVQAPWDLEIVSRDATAPSIRRILADRDWTRDPVLRHADTRKDRG